MKWTVAHERAAHRGLDRTRDAVDVAKPRVEIVGVGVLVSEIVGDVDGVSDTASALDAKSTATTNRRANSGATRTPRDPQMASERSRRRLMTQLTTPHTKS